MVERTLHLWEDGFSIDDGALFRYDDPRNRHILEMINRGNAPLDLMNVEPGQAVDVRLDEHRGEKYVQPKKKYTPFGGSGQRLGSPVPGEASAATPASRAATTASTTSATSSSEPQTNKVDDAQPTISLQIRLGDGSRLVSRFNTTQTIGDVYDFVSRANPGSTARAYVLAATFPTKDLTDKAQILGEMAEYKRGGVVVQKWT
jgi:UBX domain-containing protein 1